MTKNVRAEREEETMEEMMTGICRYYGLEWQQIKEGSVLIDSGEEFWILKIKSNKVRKLLHQNHNKSGKSLSLGCDISNLADIDTVHKLFHDQETEEKDIKKVLKYIYNHGKMRKNLDQQRQQFLQIAFA